MSKKKPQLGKRARRKAVQPLPDGVYHTTAALAATRFPHAERGGWDRRDTGRCPDSERFRAHPRD